VNAFTESDTKDEQHGTEGKVHRRYNLKQMRTDFMTSDVCKQAMLKVIQNIECNRETQEELDGIYECFSENVIHEMNRSIPYIDCTDKTRKRYKCRKHFWNDELQTLWLDMNVKEKQLKRCVNRKQRQTLFRLFRTAQHCFDKRFRYHERKSRLEVCENIESLQTQDPKEFWNQLNNFGPRKKKTIPLEVYTDNNEITSQPEIVLNKWKNEFSRLYNNFDDTVPANDRFADEIKQSNNVREMYMQDPLYECDMNLNRNFGIDEVKLVVMKGKNGKSPGVDTIPYEVLKNDVTINVLIKLFQMCFDSGKIPSLWRKAIISPIPKDEKNDKRVPLNYRGISLICCTAKLYSSLLNVRIDQFLSTGDKIVDEQNGFRKNRSCQDHLFVLDSVVRNRQKENLSTFAAFVDLKKAFDCVNREFLMQTCLLRHRVER
jgi:hypothetical protein